MLETFSFLYGGFSVFYVIMVNSVVSGLEFCPFCLVF